ncbi:MAG: signal recognition particle-docking protein FtsY [Rhodospirillales bacterium]|nr:signal recognition particle-docking protein FtsY [Rhodospirillales bacterium]
MTEDAKADWLTRLQRGLGRTSSRFKTAIADLVRKRTLDAAALADIVDLLIQTDIGVATAGKLVQSLGRFDREVETDEVLATLAEGIENILSPVARPLVIDRARKPHVVLVAGVNGSGKTTTIGKFARRFREQGLNVVLAAGDTFRAAAIEQLQIWGTRADCPVVAKAPGADAAGVAFEALERARAEGADVLLVDTAGRLQNKADLMGELQKIVRALKKIDPAAPDTCLLVMDATVGQNAHSQVETFREMVNVTGLVLTKLDGTAKGGVVVALAERFGLPVHAIGVGEAIDDLQPFEAGAFARSLVGLS